MRAGILASEKCKALLYTQATIKWTHQAANNTIKALFLGETAHSLNILLPCCYRTMISTLDDILLSNDS